MSRKLTLLLTVCLLVVTCVPGNVAVAQRPEPPKLSSSASAYLPNIPQPEVAAQPEAIALKESLSAAQTQAIQAVLAQYEPELQALAAQLPAPTALQNIASSARAPLAPENIAEMAKVDVQLIQTVIAQAQAVQAKIDQGIAAILPAEQWAQFQAGLNPAYKHLAAAQALAQTTAANAVKPQLNSSYAYYAGQFASLAEFYGWYAYVYAYYNYYYNYYGSYYCYYYAEYAENYTFAGLAKLGGGYFDLLTLGSDFNSYVYNGYYNEAYATDYSSYAYSYCNNNYSYYGYTYAYYATIYSYYTNYYAYYAYIYGYYAYYY